MSATSPVVTPSPARPPSAGSGPPSSRKDSGRSELRLATEAVRRRPRRRRAHAGRRRRHGHLHGRTPTPRSRWPAPSASATSPSSAGSTTAAGRRAPPSTRRPWPWPAAWPTSWCATGPSTSARATASAPASRAGPRRPTPRTPTSPGTRPQGLLTPASWVAMFAQRYLHVTGATSEDFGRVAVADRAVRGDQPEGVVLRASRSRWRTTRRRAGSSSRCTCSTAARRPTAARPSWSRASSGPATWRRPPAVIEAAAQGSGAQQDMMTSLLPRRHDPACPRWAWWPASCGRPRASAPTTSQCAILYDHFTPFVLYQLEELGFCEWGEAKDFLRDGNIGSAGSCPSTPTAASWARPTSTA